MQIEINKDFETEYKDDWWKGFTFRETAIIAVAVIVSIIVCYCLYKYAGMPLEWVIYTAIPLILPILFLGFYRYQDMTLWEFVKELLYEDDIQVLCWNAAEYEYPEIPKEKNTSKNQKKNIRIMRRKHRKKIKVQKKMKSGQIREIDKR